MQSDERRAVGVVLDSRNLIEHAVLVALEVDNAVMTLVAVALITSDGVAVVCVLYACAGRKERILRLASGNLLEVGNPHKATARANRLVLLDSYTFFLFFLKALSRGAGNASLPRPLFARLVAPQGPPHFVNCPRNPPGMTYWGYSLLQAKRELFLSQMSMV